MARGLTITVPASIFMVAGLYFMFTGKDENTQFLGLLLTAISLFLIWIE